MKRYSLIGFVLLSFGACQPHTETNTTSEQTKSDTTASTNLVSFNPKQLNSVGIEVGTPTLENVSGVLTLQGTVAIPPQGIISVSFPLGGYLQSTELLPGLRVRKGQVLAELEDMQFIQLQQDYLTAKEKLILAESEFNRQKDLNLSKASSDKVFQQARADMEAQHILVNALAQKLEVIGIRPANLKPDNISKSVAIRSPINGFVSKVNVNVGKYTAPTDMLFELVDPQDIHLVLNVFEKDLNALSVGQHVQAYTNGDPGKKYRATIILINKNLDQDRMAQVQCHFENYSPVLAVGTFMNGEVSVQNKKALTVPENAIVRWENKSYVFTEQRTGAFKMVEVIPGLVNQGRQQIAGSGIHEATRIVIKNAYTLLMKIKNTEAEG